MPAKFSAQEIFATYKSFALAQEKIVAIEQAPADSPALVVAGAGSGKTELLSVRVMYLVANSLARPEQILGLTFTKKAANELSKRINEALLQLRESKFWPSELEMDFVPPTISTYNAFANQIFKEAALYLGYESDATLLSDAAAFKLATEVCLNQSADLSERLSNTDLGRNRVVEEVIELAKALNDNQVEAAEVSEFIQGVSDFIEQLPIKSGDAVNKRNKYIVDLLGNLRATPLIAELASRYQREKRDRSQLDYSDQVLLAYRGVTELPELASRIRASYSQVLLDEYQDTSVLQTRLLSHLFANCAVYAVGDPNQAIYGWRGASSTNLDEFAGNFGSAKVFSLQTSWRNPRSVLAIANHTAAPLSEPASFETSNQPRIRPVTLAPRDDAQVGELVIDFSQTIEQEAAEVANWLAPRASEGKSCAVLLRTKSSFGLFVDELQKRGLEVEVVGVGGLMQLPEIVDLVCALRVIQRSDSGSELIRLLTGARWRIGIRDIDALHRLARILSGSRKENLRVEDLTLVEALDALRDSSLKAVEGFSEVGLARCQEAAKFFANLRQATALPLADFVRLVAGELRLDIELLANPSLKNPLNHLGAFYELVAGYATSSAAANLSGFLDWLEFASTKEKFDRPVRSVESGVVQVLTVHAAKGLEWDWVALPNLVEDEFPTSSKESYGWLYPGKLPFPLRGDSASLPEFKFRSAQTQAQLNSLREEFKGLNRERQLREERRLMYVALTRAREGLRLSGSYWKPASQRGPSQFLLEIAEGRFEIPEVLDAVNPLSASPKTQLWPLQPLSDLQRERLTRAAEETLAAAAELGQTEPVGSWHDEIDLLLAEQDERHRALESVELPVRVPASKFKDFITDAKAQAELYLRPVPTQPYRATKLGTQFHSWVEAFLIQENTDSPAIGIGQLQEIFRGSRFATMKPVDVELEINLTHSGNTFICKLDAVFEQNGRFEIVDWKTGAAPKDEEQEQLMTLQLALYRFAYSAIRKIPIESIDVCFYFVQENRELIPRKVPSPEQLMSLWEKIFD